MALSPGTHGVIVTHGIGDNTKPGDILADFTNGLADYLMESHATDKTGKPMYPEIRREADLSADPPSVILHLKSPSGETASWLCKEAFWGDAFPPPSASSVAWWLLGQNLQAQLRFVWKGISSDPSNSAIDDSREWTADRLLTSRHRAKLSVEGITIPFLAGFAYFLLLVVWISHYLPAFGPVATVQKWLHKFDPFLSNSLGDVQRYVVHGIWSANARERMEKVLKGMLNDEYGTVQDITLVAHSMGCVVAFDSLATGGEVAVEIARLESQGKRKKLALVTVGSGINQVFPMALKSTNIFARTRFQESLAKEITGYDENAKQDAKTLQNKFFWLDIFARRDPVPAGGLSQALFSQAKLSPSQFKPRPVINTDSMILDHISYWANHDLVMPRIARAINGGTDYPWPEARITPARIEKRTRQAASFSRNTNIALLVLLIGVIAYITLRFTGVL